MNFDIVSSQEQVKACDLLILGVGKEKAVQHSPRFQELEAKLGGQINTVLAEEEIDSFKEITCIHTLGQFPAKRVLFVGLGQEKDLNMEKWRELIARITQEAIRYQAEKIGYCLDSFLVANVEVERLAHLVAETTLLAAYRFDHYKTEKKEQEKVKLNQVTLYSEADREQLSSGLMTGEAYAIGTCLARDLVNTPGNLLTPTDLAAKAVEIAKRHQFDYTILDRKEMEALGMGALLAVAQGSEQPPKMIVLKYQGLPEWDKVIGFVGKGLTFDTGGISIKPSAKMDEMKMDLGGAASVLGAMEVIGRLKPRCNVLAVIPSTENMPSGKALKPGDVITSLSGKTIEVKNTDAEGRLILADGITYAKQLGASYLVDVATLTGAVLIALGDCTTGAVTNNEDWMIEVLEAAQENGELIWRLPDFEPYKKMVRSSEVADLNNAPGRLAGSITAGLFLGEFAGDTPWVHLDIAGTAWSERNTDLTRKGGTGVMVRTLATLVERMSL